MFWCFDNICWNSIYKALKLMYMINSKFMEHLKFDNVRLMIVPSSNGDTKALHCSFDIWKDETHLLLFEGTKTLQDSNSSFQTAWWIWSYKDVKPYQLVYGMCYIETKYIVWISILKKKKKIWEKKKKKKKDFSGDLIPSLSLCRLMIFRIKVGTMSRSLL